MTEPKFTFEWYGELLERLQEDTYSFVLFDEELSDKTAILRHDVDWSPRKAVRMAEIEAEKGVTATYFFLVSSPFYNVVNERERKQIARIVELGHEVGLHFSTHQYFDSEPADRVSEAPPDEELLTAVDRELDILKTVSGEAIDVVSFHNPPEWVLKTEYSGFISTYEPRFFDAVEYCADSNQRWREEPPFPNGIPDTVQILTHPVLWGEYDGWATDRLREVRDFHSRRVNRHLERTDRTWKQAQKNEYDW